MKDLLARSRGGLSGWLAGAAKRAGIRIFRYHGVVERKTDAVREHNQHTLARFAAHARYLSRFRVRSLSELLSEIEAPPRRSSTRPLAVVTFDDGFANNLATAEVLSRRRLPWILFVPSEEVGERRAMWLVELSLLLVAGSIPRVEALGELWPLGSRGERERSFRSIRGRLKGLAYEARRAALEWIRSQFPAGETERLLREYPSLRSLTWDEIGQLAGSGVEIGSHGVHDEMHHAGQPAGERLKELTDSRREIEERLRRPCRAFAYPNGDAVAESPAEVARAGYEAAFTTENASAVAGISRYLLPRLEAPGSLAAFVKAFWWQPSDGPAASAAIQAGA